MPLFCIVWYFSKRAKLCSSIRLALTLKHKSTLWHYRVVPHSRHSLKIWGSRGGEGGEIDTQPKEEKGKKTRKCCNELSGSNMLSSDYVNGKQFALESGHPWQWRQCGGGRKKKFHTGPLLVVPWKNPFFSLCEPLKHVDLKLRRICCKQVISHVTSAPLNTSAAPCCIRVCLQMIFFRVSELIYHVKQYITMSIFGYCHWLIPLRHITPGQRVKGMWMSLSHSEIIVKKRNLSNSQSSISWGGDERPIIKRI